MTTEEFTSEVMLRVAGLQSLAAEFFAEAYEAGYAKGYDDREQERPFSPDADTSTDDDDWCELDG